MKGRLIMIRLRELRKQRKVSQKELADYLNITQVQISKYELGKNEPDLETISKIATFFNVTIDYILGKDPSDLILISREDFKTLKKASDIIQRIDQIANPKVGGVHSIENNTITTNGDVIGDVIIGANIKNK